jgi:uncharacterized membrane protein
MIEWIALGIIIYGICRSFERILNEKYQEELHRKKTLGKIRKN